MITVKELIEELKQFSPDAPVEYWDEFPEDVKYELDEDLKAVDL